MVAKAEVYMCQYCSSIYLEEKDAIECEQSHAAPDLLKVIDCRKWTIDQYGDSRFPSKILIEEEGMSGRVAEYHLQNVGSIEDFYEREPWNELGEWGSKQVNDQIGDIENESS